MSEPDSLGVGKQRRSLDSEVLDSGTKPPGGQFSLISGRRELIEPEDSLQDGRAGSRGRLKEQLEPALREYHGAHEGIVVQPDQALDLVGDRDVVIESDGRVVEALEFVAPLRAGTGG